MSTHVFRQSHPGIQLASCSIQCWEGFHLWKNVYVLVQLKALTISLVQWPLEIIFLNVAANLQLQVSM